MILTSIHGLVVQAQTTLDRGEVLAQFATLQSQFDELRNDIATSRVGTLLPAAAELLPYLLTSRRRMRCSNETCERRRR